MNETVAAGLGDVRARILRAERRFGRPEDSTRLVAVSKTQAAERVAEAIDAGQRLFGENRVQEALAKFPALRERHADLELHLIGPLQTNKAREAVRLFDVIHTLDRDRLAEALAKEIGREGRAPRLLIEVNTGEEAQKAGIAPRDTAAFVARCREAHGLDVAGLMCIPPAEEAPGPHFAFLVKLARDCGLDTLSMGMSGDFETAIRFGATFVRVGSAIFGARPAAHSADAAQP